MNVFPRMLERIDKLTFSNRSNLTTCSIAESNQSNLSNSKTSWNSTITLGGCFRHYLFVRCSKQAIARKGLERGLRPRDTSRGIILSTQHPMFYFGSSFSDRSCSFWICDGLLILSLLQADCHSHGLVKSQIVKIKKRLQHHVQMWE